jgi:hypothetical protein
LVEKVEKLRMRWEKLWKVNLFHWHFIYNSGILALMGEKKEIKFKKVYFDTYWPKLKSILTDIERFMPDNEAEKLKNRIEEIKIIAEDNDILFLRLSEKIASKFSEGKELSDSQKKKLLDF